MQEYLGKCQETSLEYDIIERSSSNGPHTRMLAVLLPSDDPRTRWSFHLVRRLLGATDTVGRTFDYMRASLQPKLQHVVVVKP